ncbi:unnamed protein product [Ectocarpus sp. 12 AP-2014]
MTSKLYGKTDANGCQLAHGDTEGWGRFVLSICLPNMIGLATQSVEEMLGGAESGTTPSLRERWFRSSSQRGRPPP